MFAKLGIPYQVTTKTVKKSGKKVKVEYIDERPVFAAMINSGTMDQKMLLTMRSKMEKKFDTFRRVNGQINSDHFNNCRRKENRD